MEAKRLRVSGFTVDRRQVASVVAREYADRMQAQQYDDTDQSLLLRLAAALDDDSDACIGYLLNAHSAAILQDAFLTDLFTD